VVSFPPVSPARPNTLPSPHSEIEKWSLSDPSRIYDTSATMCHNFFIRHQQVLLLISFCNTQLNGVSSFHPDLLLKYFIRFYSVLFNEFAQILELGEVKPSVPCRRFAACKRSLNLRGSRNLGKITTGHLSRPQFHLSLLGSIASLRTEAPRG